MPKYRSLAVQLLLLPCLMEVENHDRRQPRNGTCLQDWLVAQGELHTSRSRIEPREMEERAASPAAYPMHEG
jgi:hypothetical protein